MIFYRNESFSQICVQILLIDQLPIIKKVFSLIIQEERQRAIKTTPSIEAVTLMTNPENKR